MTKTCGFTLLEIIVVAIVVGIIACIAVPRFVSTRTRAEASEAIAWLNEIHLAQQRCIVEKYGGFDPSQAFDGTCAYNSTTGDVLDIGAPRGNAGFSYVTIWLAGYSAYYIKACKAGRCIFMRHGYGRSITNDAACTYGGVGPGPAFSDANQVVVYPLFWQACTPYKTFMPQ